MRHRYAQPPMGPRVVAAPARAGLARHAAQPTVAFRVAVGVTSLLALSVIPGVARAQRVEKPPAEAVPTPAPVTLTPPVLKTDPGAVYPQLALQSKVKVAVTVELTLVIDPSGAVSSATSLDARGNGFDEAAEDNARHLVFEPARRNGVAIAAKIKYAITFPVQNARIAGRVQVASTAAFVEGADVALIGPDGLGYTTRTAADGTFGLGGIAPGTYSVRIAKDGFDVSEQTEEIDPASELRFAIRLSETQKDAPTSADPKATVKTKPADNIEEVNVKGVRAPREVTRRTFEQRELSRIPGTNGDALRAIQNFPGVARPPGLAGLLIVRGSAPNDTNVFVDGTLIPLVYHFGGLSSVIPTEMLEKIDFYPGNFSSQYGRVQGGVVDVGMRAPKSDKFHGMAQVDLIDLRLMAEGPLGKGWSFAVAGRRSYFDTWLGPVLDKAGAGVTTAPRYYDYQLVLNKEWSKDESLRLAFFGSDDSLAILQKSVGGTDPGLSGSLSLNTAFYRLQAKYRKRFNAKTELRVVAAGGRDSLGLALGSNYLKIDSAPLTVRAEVSHKLAKGVTTTGGIDWLWAPYEVAIRLPPQPRPGEPPGGPFLSRPPLTVKDKDAIYRPGIYNEFELTPWPGGRVVAGARLDYAKDTQKWDFSPRFVVRQDLTKTFPRTTIKGGVGIFRQPPQPQETNPIFGISGLTSNRAVHYSAGVEQEFSKQIELSVEGFYRDLDNLVVPNVGNTGIGRAFGVETLLRYKPDARFFGFFAYTLSRSERQDKPSEPERVFGFDQTHILTVLGSYRLGRGWEVGARFRLTSGSMSSPNARGFFDGNSGVYLPVASNFNQERLPTFHQLDLRVDKTWDFKTWKLGAYLDLINSSNAPNVEGISYNYDYTLRTYGGSLPIIPSFGIRGEL